MKFFYTFSFAGLFSTTLLFSKMDISHEIKKLKQADESHRYVIMNRIKQQIATMNARQRSSAIALLRNKTSSGNSIPVSQAAGPGSTGKTTVSSPSNISAPRNSHTGPSHSSPATHPQTGPRTGPQSGPQSGPQAQPQTGPQTGPQAHPQTGGPQTQPQSPQTGPQSAPQTGPQSAPQSGPQTQPQTGPQSAPQSGPQSAPQSGPQAQPQSPQTGPQTQPQTGPQSTPQSGPQMPHHLPRPKSGRH